MVLEFVPGRDLSEILHDTSISSSEFNWLIRTKIALDIALAIRYLHHQITPPIMHGDLRSPNCFVVSLDINIDKAHCKVADFGLAQRMYVTSSERLLTWQWVAPEVLDDTCTYDQRADIFSYGVLLWEIATRQFPYDEFEKYKTKRHYKLSPEQLQDENKLNEMTLAGWNINRVTGDAEIVTADKHKFTELIVKDNLRPTIPDTVSDEFAYLIRTCWAQDPKDRPSLNTIIATLACMLPISLVHDETALELRESRPMTTQIGPIKLDLLDVNRPNNIDVIHNTLEPLLKPISCLNLVDETVWAGCTDGKIYIFDIKSGKLISKILAHKKEILCISIVNVEHIWSGGADSVIYIHKRRGRIKKPKQLKGHSGIVVAILALDKDKEKKYQCRVWTADTEGTIIVWKNGNIFKKFNCNDPITSMCLSPNGETVCISTTISQLLLYDIKDCSHIKTHQISEVSKPFYIYSINSCFWIVASKGPLYIYGTDLQLISEINEGIGGHCIIEVKTMVWITDENCIYIVDAKSYCVLKKIESVPTITCMLLLDKEGQIWSGSSEEDTIRRWFFSL